MPYFFVTRKTAALNFSSHRPRPFRRALGILGMLTVSSTLLSQCSSVKRDPLVLMHNQVKVERGDSLESLAYRYGVSPKSLARANGLTFPYCLVPGQILLLPGRSGEPECEEGPVLLGGGAPQEPLPSEEPLETSGPSDGEGLLGEGAILEKVSEPEEEPGKGPEVKAPLKSPSVASGTPPQKKAPPPPAPKPPLKEKGFKAPVNIIRGAEGDNYVLVLQTQAHASVRSPVEGVIKYAGEGIQDPSSQMVVIEPFQEKNALVVLGPLKSLQVQEDAKVSQGQYLGDLDSKNKKSWSLLFEVWDWDSRKVRDARPFLSPSFKKAIHWKTSPKALASKKKKAPIKKKAVHHKKA